MELALVLTSVKITIPKNHCQHHHLFVSNGSLNGQRHGKIPTQWIHVARALFQATGFILVALSQVQHFCRSHTSKVDGL